MGRQRRARRRRSAATPRISLRTHLARAGLIAGVVGFGTLAKTQPALVEPAALCVLALAVGRVAFAVRRRLIERRRLRDLDGLRTLSPLEFEQHVADHYRRCGYRVNLTKRVGDQGVDIIAIAEADDERIGIQVKHHQSAVGNAAVQEVVAGLRFHDCTNGAVVTTGRFTPAARALAEANGIELIDGEAYIERIARRTGHAAADDEDATDAAE